MPARLAGESAVLEDVAGAPVLLHGQRQAADHAISEHVARADGTAHAASITFSVSTAGSFPFMPIARSRWSHFSRSTLALIAPPLVGRRYDSSPNRCAAYLGALSSLTCPASPYHL